MSAQHDEHEEHATYSIEEVDALTVRARRLLEQLRDVLAEIGDRMTTLTEGPHERSGGPGGTGPQGS